MTLAEVTTDFTSPGAALGSCLLPRSAQHCCLLGNPGVLLLSSQAHPASAGPSPRLRWFLAQQHSRPSRRLMLFWGDIITNNSEAQEWLCAGSRHQPVSLGMCSVCAWRMGGACQYSVLGKLSLSFPFLLHLRRRDTAYMLESAFPSSRRGKLDPWEGKR